MKLMQFAGMLCLYSRDGSHRLFKKTDGSFTLKLSVVDPQYVIKTERHAFAENVFEIPSDMSASVSHSIRFSLLGAGMLAGLIINSFSKATEQKSKTVPRKLFLYGTILSVILFSINQFAHRRERKTFHQPLCSR